MPYLPTSDAWTGSSPGNANLFDALVHRVGPDVLGTISRAGLAFDLVDDEVLARSARIVPAGLAIGALTYRAIVLPGVERIPVTTLRMLEDFAGSGGVLIATRRTPGRAPGFRATPDGHASVRAASARLFQASGAPGRLVSDEREELQRALTEGVHADARFTPAAPDVGSCTGACRTRTCTSSPTPPTWGCRRPRRSL